MERIFTSESVSRGHPDKLADQISDAVLDEFLYRDKNSRVACETFITDGLVVVGGETHSSVSVNVKSIAENVLKGAGYTSEFCFDPSNFGLINTMQEQSSDIRLGVEKDGAHLGAGDQGIMFGYACNETLNYMPLPIELSNKTMMLYDMLRKEPDGEFSIMGPDAKCQYSVVYDGNKPVRVSNILISMQHKESASQDAIAKCAVSLINNVMSYNPEFAKYIDFNTTKININPTGRFVIGGPKGDTGLTGRKIIIDTYGGRAPHGGGAFSGKDATKVDRSAAYMARFLAKNVVAAGRCNECLIQLSYSIGGNVPVSVYVRTDSGDEYDEKVRNVIENDLKNHITPFGIINYFKLYNPIFYPTSFFGHFGRDCIDLASKDNPRVSIKFFPWEEINEDIKQLFR